MSNSRIKSGVWNLSNSRIKSGVRSPEPGAGFCGESDFGWIRCSSRLKLQTPDSRLNQNLKLNRPVGPVEQQNQVRSPESGAGFCGESNFSCIQGSSRLKLRTPDSRLTGNPGRPPAAPMDYFAPSTVYDWHGVHQKP